MKVRKLYFFQPTFVGVMKSSVDLSSHDIAIGGPGYIVTERRSDTSFLVHAATCTAELEKEGDDDGAADAAAGAVPRRGTAPKKPAQIPPG